MRKVIFSLMLFATILLSLTVLHHIASPSQTSYDMMIAEKKRIEKLLLDDIDPTKVPLNDKAGMVAVIIEEEVSKHLVTLLRKSFEDFEKKLKTSTKNSKLTKESISVAQKFVDVIASRIGAAYEQAWPEIAERLATKLKLSDAKKAAFLDMKDAYIKSVEEEEDQASLKLVLTAELLNPYSPENSEIKADLEALYTNLKKQIEPTNTAAIDKMIDEILAD